MDSVMQSESGCCVCDTPTAYANGGFTCLAVPGVSMVPRRICRVCTTAAVAVWAREFMRLRVPPPKPPTPTAPPTGATSAPLLAARAA
jgi:hypothetical protein